MLYIDESIANLNAEALDAALAALPAWRRAQALRYKHQRGQAECALSYLLLCRALRERDIEVQPTFDYGENGKPRLLELPDVHFNLSHCKTAVVCTVSEEPVGVDVETLGRYSERLARYTMNEKELAEIARSSDHDLAFTRLWTMKEATMKLTGEGISTNVRDVLAAHSYNIIYRSRVNVERGYVVTEAEFASEE